MAAKKTAKATISNSSPAELPPKPTVKPAAARPSLDWIARAAYLNYRRRVEQGLPGDSQSDWLEAERQSRE
jgi:hypothetical protein